MKRFHPATRSVWLGLIWLLNACATHTAPPRPASHQIGAAFSLEGRIAVKDQVRRYNVRLNWQHNGQSDDLLLSSPLGQGLAAFSSRPGRATLDLADKRHVESATLDGLAEQVFGRPLPLARLSDWARGQAATGVVVARDALGRPLDFEEAGWKIRYLSYDQETADGLPRHLHLQRDDTELDLMIESWAAEPPQAGAP